MDINTDVKVPVKYMYMDRKKEENGTVNGSSNM